MPLVTLYRYLVILLHVLNPLRPIANASWSKIYSLTSDTYWNHDKKWMAEMAKLSRNTWDVQARVSIVPHGYQIDVRVSGAEWRSSCRDFSDSWNTDDAAQVVADQIASVMRDIESKFESQGIRKSEINDDQ